MAIVIGAASNAGIANGNYCVLSVNWGYNPGAQRLYCLGSWSPYETYYRPTETLNLTIYAPGPTYNVEPTQDCVDANTIAAYVDPAACGDETYDGFDGQWWVTGYSYNKDDASMPGQETWSLTRWKDLTTADPNPATTTEPSYVMRNISEGQGTLNAGLSFLAAGLVQSTTGNVSAGGFGRADTVYIGTIDQVGGGSSTAGETGQGSATLNYTQLYI